MSAHRKRLVLLAVVVAHGDRGISRDKLLALLWPESETDRARTSLKQAVFALRRSAGDPRIIAGTSELRVDQTVLRYDVAEFETALRRGDRDAALAMYSGPFMEGVHVSASPELEHWIDLERQRLAALFRDAALSFAFDAIDQGKLADAMSILSRLVALDPLDDAAVRGLIRAHVSAADVTAARTLAERYDRMRGEESGVAPNPSAIDWVATLESIEARPSASQPLSPRATPSEFGPVAGERSRARARPGKRGVQRVLIAASVAAVAFIILRGRPRSSEPAPLTEPAIMIVPLPQTDTLLRRELAAAVRATSSLLSLVGNVRIARDCPADSAVHAITIDIAAVADDLNLVGAWCRQDSLSLRANRSTLEVIGAPENLHSLGTQLGARIAGMFLGPSAAMLTDAASHSTRSVLTLTAYVEGEAKYRAGHFADAADAFQRSVTLDSTFAVGWYRLSVTCDWAARSECSMRAAERAASLPANLDQHTRLLLDALRAWHDSDLESADRIYGYITAQYPRDAEAWYQLGDARFHLGPLSGLPIDNARLPFERVLALDAGHVEATIHLARLAALRGDVRAADTLFTQAIRRSDSTARRELIITRLFAIQDSIGIRAFLAQASRESDDLLSLVANRLVSYGNDLDGAARVFRVLTAADRPLATRAAAHMGLAQLATIRGRVREADSEFALAAPPGSSEALVAYARQRRELLRSLPAMPASLPPLAAVTSNVRSSTKVQSSVGGWAPPDLRDPVERGFGDPIPIVDTFLAGLSAKGGRTRAWEAAVHSLESVSGQRADSAHALARFLRLVADIHAHAWHEAAARFDPRPNSPLWYAVRPVERYLHAVALSHDGRTADALQWLATFDNVGDEDMTMAAPAHMLRARLLKRSGQTGQARAERNRAYQLWSNCDSTLRSALAATP